MAIAFRPMHQGEDRKAYVMRVAAFHILNNASEDETHFDDANCDGHCIADELKSWADEIDAGRN